MSRRNLVHASAKCEQPTTVNPGFVTPDDEAKGSLEMATTAIGGRDVYVKAALFGLSLFVVGMLLYLIPTFIDEPASVPFNLFFLVSAAIVAAVLRQWRRWGLCLGILAGVYYPLVFLSHPEYLAMRDSFFEFTVALLVSVGSAILLISSMIGTIQ